MSEFPATDFHKPVISSWSAEAIGVVQSVEDNTTGSVGGSGTWPSANLAIFVPFVIRAPYLVNTLWWCNGTAVAGNVDCGVYTSDGTLLFSAGSTAQATVSIQQKVSVSGGFLLLPGSYYMALAASSTSAQFIRRGTATAAMLQMYGLAQQASALALPATFTLATIANAYLPVFGIAKATVL